jgi:hypothetical protein
METPHYLRFVRALAFVTGAGCSDNTTMTGADAAPDVLPDVAAPDVASPDVAAPDVASPDVASPDVSVADVAMDARPDAAPDAPAPDAPAPDVAMDVRADLSPMLDVAADDGGTTPDGSVSPDVAADVDPCPMTAPSSGGACDTPRLSCRYDTAGGGFTSCFCTEMGAMRTWSCATAVPGPLPPPEFIA